MCLALTTMLILSNCMEGLATTYSPASLDEGPSALGAFTSEFGMGSGVETPARAGKIRCILMSLSVDSHRNTVQLVDLRFT